MRVGHIPSVAEILKWTNNLANNLERKHVFKCTC